MSGLDWGTVPTWASAILTSGSLFLGFYILLRDRTKAEQGEAVKVIFWQTWEDGEAEGVVYQRIHVLNTATRPISSVSAQVVIGTGDGPRQGRKCYEFPFALPGVLRPDEEATIDVDERPSPLVLAEPVFGKFTDADGVRWARRLEPFPSLFRIKSGSRWRYYRSGRAPIAAGGYRQPLTGSSTHAPGHPSTPPTAGHPG